MSVHKNQKKASYTPGGYWEACPPYSGPLVKQQVLLTSEPSLQAPRVPISLRSSMSQAFFGGLGRSIIVPARGREGTGLESPWDILGQRGTLQCTDLNLFICFQPKLCTLGGLFFLKFSWKENTKQNKNASLFTLERVYNTL